MTKPTEPIARPIETAPVVPKTDPCACGYVLKDHNEDGACLVRSGPYGEYCLCEKYDTTRRGPK